MVIWRVVKQSDIKFLSEPMIIGKTYGRTWAPLPSMVSLLLHPPSSSSACCLPFMELKLKMRPTTCTIIAQTTLSSLPTALIRGTLTPFYRIYPPIAPITSVASPVPLQDRANQTASTGCSSAAEIRAPRLAETALLTPLVRFSRDALWRRPPAYGTDMNLSLSLSRVSCSILRRVQVKH